MLSEWNHSGVSDSGEQLGTSGVDVMVSMNKDCKNKAAMKFIRGFLADSDGQQYWVNYLQGAPVSNDISYTGTVDGELQQQSIDDVNKYVFNAAGSRKLSTVKSRLHFRSQCRMLRREQIH